MGRIPLIQPNLMKQFGQQFWSCPEKEAFIARCRYSIYGKQHAGGRLPVLEQYGILADYADAVLELFPDCIGIY